MEFTIGQARRYKGLTQIEMSKKLGVSLQTYFNYEQGKSIMKVNIAKKFSGIVKIPFDQIIFYDKTTKI